MLDSLVRFSDWLGATSFSAFAAQVSWVVPTVQTIHILAIAVVMVAVAMVNMRVLGLIDGPVATLARGFMPPVLIALVVLALTGVVMVASEPHRALFRTVFWVKMLLVVVGLAVNYVMVKVVQAQGEAASGASMPWGPRVLAALTLLLWVAVIFSGRWIAYALPWEGAPN